MNDGEKKALLLAGCVGVVGFTVLTLMLLVALWPYRIVVGACLLLVVLIGSVALCVVVVRGNASPPPLPAATLKYEERRRLYDYPS